MKCIKPEYRPSRMARELIGQIAIQGNKEILFKNYYDKENNRSNNESDLDMKYKDLMNLYSREKALNKNNKVIKGNNQFQSKSHQHQLTYNFINRVPWISNVCKINYQMNHHGSFC